MSRYYITDHAVTRCMERLPACKGMKYAHAREWLTAQLVTAAPVMSYHNGKEQALAIQGGIVILVGNAIKTVLNDAMYQTRLDCTTAVAFGGRHRPAHTPAWLVDALAQAARDATGGAQ